MCHLLNPQLNSIHSQAPGPSLVTNTIREGGTLVTIKIVWRHITLAGSKISDNKVGKGRNGHLNTVCRFFSPEVWLTSSC